MEGLCFSRKKNEIAVIDLRKYGLGLIEVMPIEIRGGKARLMFSGDRSIPIHRKEVFEEIERNGSRVVSGKLAREEVPLKADAEVQRDADCGQGEAA
jgi:sRNA-binding carbon storage regulator CsrA